MCWVLRKISEWNCFLFNLKQNFFNLLNPFFSRESEPCSHTWPLMAKPTHVGLPCNLRGYWGVLVATFNRQFGFPISFAHLLHAFTHQIYNMQFPSSVGWICTHRPPGYEPGKLLLLTPRKQENKGLNLNLPPIRGAVLALDDFPMYPKIVVRIYFT